MILMTTREKYCSHLENWWINALSVILYYVLFIYLLFIHFITASLLFSPYTDHERNNVRRLPRGGVVALSLSSAHNGMLDESFTRHLQRYIKEQTFRTLENVSLEHRYG